MYQGIYKDHIYIDRKEAITQMKKKRTFNVDFSDRKLNERPYIEVISVNYQNVYMCAVKRVSYNKKTDNFHIMRTNLLNGEMITTSEDYILNSMCDIIFTDIIEYFDKL